MNKIIMLILIALLTAGCTNQTTCPTITCPTITCPTVAPAQLNNPTFVYVINVGEGNAELIKNGEAEMLMDCGNNDHGQTVVDFLKEKKVNDLEYLLITHPDSDHLGGCDTVLDNVKVQTVITNGITSDTVSYKDVIAKLDSETQIIANVGNSWQIGGATVRVIQANNGLSDDNQNSIVTKLTFGTTDMLFTGDCDNKCEEMLIYKDVQSELLVVPHHGSKYGSKTAFLEAVKPQVAIISVGENSYGHPAPEVLDRIAEEGTAIYRTDNGTITVKMDSNGYEVIK